MCLCDVHELLNKTPENLRILENNELLHAYSDEVHTVDDDFPIMAHPGEFYVLLNTL